MRIFGCVGLALASLTTGFAADLDLSGSVRYHIKGAGEDSNDRVTLELGKIENRGDDKSGGIKIELWATGDSVDRIASVKLDSLESGQHYFDIIRTVPADLPDDGTYTIFLTVSEDNGPDWDLCDEVTFSNSLRISDDGRKFTKIGDDDSTPQPVIEEPEMVTLASLGLGQAVGDGDGWFSHPSFGEIYDLGGGWLFAAEAGRTYWLTGNGDFENGGLWYWDEAGQDWAWTSSRVFPLGYAYGLGDWFTIK